MADVKISALSAIASVAAEDLIAIIDDPSGTPASRKATMTQLSTFLKSLSETLTNKTISLTNNTVTGTSAELATAISDETGSGVLVFGTAPTIDSPSTNYAINAQTGTTYTFVLLDAGKIVTSSNASAVTVTIPPNSSVAYPVGSSIEVISIGAGLTSFAQGTGVTISSTGATATAPQIRAQYSSATAIKTATNTWIVVGDITQ